MKIFVENKYAARFPAAIKKSLEEKGNVFCDCEAECEAYVGTSLDREKLDAMKRLKAVFAPKTGADKFPLAGMRERGISLTVSHACAPYVAEHAFALTLALLHRVIELHGDLREGNWNAGRSWWNSLRDKTVGIIGFGAVGREYAKLLAPFGCVVIAPDRGKEVPPGVKKEPLQALLNESDVLLFALPRTDESAKLLTDADYALLSGKFVINVGRAETLKEEKIFGLLESGSLAGFASDVWSAAQGRSEKEAARSVSKYPFGKFRNVVMSPHCAIHASKAENVAVEDIAEKLVVFCDGGKVSNVDYDAGY